jgi:hypothetical protein
MVCLFLPAKCGGLILRRLLGRRLDDLRISQNVSELLSVEVEDASTFQKMKASTEDAGYLALDSINRRIVIEGVVCRYVVRSEDVIRLGSVSGGTTVGTEVAYRIDDRTELKIVISKTSIWSEVLRQLAGVVRNPLLKKIEETLRLGEIGDRSVDAGPEMQVPSPHDYVRTVPLSGFDPDGEPEIRVMRDGSLHVVFGAMPPLDLEHQEKYFLNHFSRQMEAEIGVPVVWEDREVFLIRSPQDDTIERIRLFVSGYWHNHAEARE